MIIAVPKETHPGERRVAMVPDALGALIKKGHEVLIESGAGDAAGIIDEHYTAKGAKIITSRRELFEKAEVIFQIQSFGASPEAGEPDLQLIRKDQVIIGAANPLGNAESAKKTAATGAIAFALELVPRITRAQSMDILSSMATVAGYKAVLWAAERLPKFFPMFMTAAGTIKPAKVFVIGAGVAGLQAIASAKRLGAVVQAYDVRPVVKEQVESLGAKFVEMELETEDAQDSGGYAKELGEDFYKKQREMMTKVVAENDVVITTAAIPGKKSPVLVTKEMVQGMHPGSVIVDLAAEGGGNCELTKAGEEIIEHGVTILGPLNVPSTVPFHASQMFTKNLTSFLMNMVDKEGKLNIDMEDEIVLGSMITRDGKVVHPRILEMMGETNDGKET
ncbi:MAG: Re/Si-specific NAD(P)(+) transhydrogenase subunit alpha [Candidatus Electryonea clarkiae]|nr:Re/Si-specific NAD(P)(+) transhydrogenase subunit alpha [Candidatus Electryonea clarkiae]MDP8288288.1 Re/Si-specific NAD(P)(+) transhydrogenase subunit alpha [Candidatus Electryonea clarkiae]